MAWTEERVELLRSLWADGLSASQIAAELGGDLTRNAVIGKIHRLGIYTGGSRGTTAIGPRARRGRRQPAAPKPALFTMVPEKPAISEPEPPAISEPEPPAIFGNPVGILELAANHCRSVLDQRDERPGPGKGLRLYCGEPRLPNIAYCARCAGIYQLFRAEAVPAFAAAKEGDKNHGTKGERGGGVERI